MQEVFEKLDDGEVGLLADPNKIIDKQERKINMEQFIAGWDAAVAGIVPLNMVCAGVSSPVAYLSRHGPFLKAGIRSEVA